MQGTYFKQISFLKQLHFLDDQISKYGYLF